jgi:hypothetical protein
MKEQNKRKKTRLCECNEVGECLCKWFLQKCSERVHTNGVLLKAQAVQFNRLLSRDETFEVFWWWLWRWKFWHGICLFNIEDESASIVWWHTNWRATDCIFVVSRSRVCPKKAEFSKQLHTQTLWGTVLPWKNKTNFCVRIWKLFSRLSVRHSGKVLCNNLILVITHWSQLHSHCFQMWIEE